MDEEKLRIVGTPIDRELVEEITGVARSYASRDVDLGWWWMPVDRDQDH